MEPLKSENSTGLFLENWIYKPNCSIVLLLTAVFSICTLFSPQKYLYFLPSL